MRNLFSKSYLLIGLLAFGLSDNLFANQTNESTYSLSQEVYERDITVPSYIKVSTNAYNMPQSEFMATNEIDYDTEIETVQTNMKFANPGVEFAKKPVIVCRKTGCTRLNDRISRNFLFNSLSNMFMLNAYSKMSICEADPFTRACLISGINFPARIGVADALIKIPYAQVAQVFLSRGLSKTEIELTYPFLVNGVEKKCKKTTADIVIPNDEQVTLYNKEFTCQLTNDAKTNVSLLLNIDYIDLDYGIIGGYYSFGMQGPSKGSGTGYLLLKTEYATTSNTGVGTYNSQDIKQGDVVINPLRSKK